MAKYLANFRTQTNNNTKCFIYNLFGQEMLTFDLFNEHNNININNNMLPSGVFIAVIYDGNKFVDSFKFIVGE
ncbi:MAG: T9SS type A sorting domain-containing protein [Bacteroidetes bacterium]|nr:T9SS type A sorting domain-containing protein [Bacteroidota bacterium]